ncbi:probable nucleoredoxin 1-2 [Quercus suber]|uniref:probable nucleoredoxin 1-2 n=1 Tax=Quercus suber TaxID=58331 RepID=UPI0032DFBE32
MSSASSNQSVVPDGAVYEGIYPSGPKDHDDSSESSSSSSSSSSTNEGLEMIQVQEVSDDEEQIVRSIVGVDGLREFILPPEWTVNAFTSTIKEGHFNTIRDRYQIPDHIPLRLPYMSEKCYYEGVDGVGVYEQVPVSELDGKMVGLYIRSVERPLFEFTPSLVEVYKILKERGENFEIVFVCLENENGSFSLYKQDFESMPWYALPYHDRRCKKLARYLGFKPTTMYHTPACPPILVIIGSDGKILNQNAAEVVEEHGVEAYPFTLERLAELEEVPVSDLSSKKMVPVSDLVGKTILLVFLERCSENADSIVQELTELYDEIKETDDAFEMILVPYNIDGHYDLNYYPPWYIRLTFPGLIVPFGDERIKSLSRKFKFYGNTMFVVLGPTGRTLRKEDAWDILTTHGVEAFPFTDDHLRDIEARFVQIAKGWPKEELHIEYCGAVTRTYDIVPTRTGSYKCSMRRLCKVWPNGYKTTTEKDDFYCEVINLYENFKKKEVNFEIVLVPLDVIYYDYKKYFGGTQWFSVPYKGKCGEKLACYFHIPPETVLMIFGSDGKIFSSNAVSIIEKYGYNAFPFTSESYAELAEMVRARVEEQTLESVLISWEKDFVINNDGAKFLLKLKWW